MKEILQKTINTPTLGTALSISSGFSFYVLCIMFSLVGPSGVRQPHYQKNFYAFLTVCLITLSFAIASLLLTLHRRKTEEIGFPKFSAGLIAVCLIILVMLFSGGFAV